MLRNFGFPYSNSTALSSRFGTCCYRILYLSLRQKALNLKNLKTIYFHFIWFFEMQWPCIDFYWYSVEFLLRVVIHEQRIPFKSKETPWKSELSAFFPAWQICLFPIPKILYHLICAYSNTWQLRCTYHCITSMMQSTDDMLPLSLPLWCITSMMQSTDDAVHTQRMGTIYNCSEFTVLYHTCVSWMHGRSIELPWTHNAVWCMLPKFYILPIAQNVDNECLPST